MLFYNYHFIHKNVIITYFLLRYEYTFTLICLIRPLTWIMYLNCQILYMYSGILRVYNFENILWSELIVNDNKIILKIVLSLLLLFKQNLFIFVTCANKFWIIPQDT
jgi:hypothetical protein